MLRKGMNDITVPLRMLRHLFENIEVRYTVDEQLVGISN